MSSVVYRNPKNADDAWTFQQDDPLPLEHWTFNTEAHPFPVFRWNSWEKHKFSQPV